MSALRSALVAIGLTAAGLLDAASPPAANVVTDGVRGIHAVGGRPAAAVLLVFVVDDSGDPLDEVQVTVRDGEKELASLRTDGRGRALFSFALDGPVTVRAEEHGCVPAVAHGVVLRKAGLTSLALPLEEAEEAK